MDGTVFSLDHADNNNHNILFDPQSNFCWQDDHREWELCEDGEGYQRVERGPSTYGPARQVAEAPFLIVVGERHARGVMMDLALYVANLHFIAFGTLTQVVLDSQLTEETLREGGYNNLILIGNTHQNEWTRRVLEEKGTVKADILFMKKEGDEGYSGFQLGPGNFSASGLGVLFTHPLLLGQERRVGLALVLAGTDVEGMRTLFELATPTIPPMVRAPFSNLIPDFMVVGTSFPQPLLSLLLPPSRILFFFFKQGKNCI